MSYVLFISEARLKKITSVHENVEPDDLVPFVTQAQDIYVQDILGTKLFDHLKDAITGSTLTGPETTLLDDYIAPMVGNWALYMALPHLNYKIKNKSVLNPSAEEAQNTGFQELKYLRGSIKDTADFYTERLRRYIDDYFSDFPDWVNPGTKGMQPQKTNQYFHGIYIPKSNNCLGLPNQPQESN